MLNPDVHCPFCSGVWVRRAREGEWEASFPFIIIIETHFGLNITARNKKKQIKFIRDINRREKLLVKFSALASLSKLSVAVFFSHSASHSPSPSHRLTPLRGRQTFGSLTLSFPLSIYAIPFSSLLCHNMYLFKHCLSPSFPFPMTLLMTIKFFSSFVLLFDGELLNKNQWASRSTPRKKNNSRKRDEKRNEDRKILERFSYVSMCKSFFVCALKKGEIVCDCGVKLTFWVAQGNSLYGK